MGREMIPSYGGRPPGTDGVFIGPDYANKVFPQGHKQVEHEIIEAEEYERIQGASFPRSLQSFYYWFCHQASGKQGRYFKYALGRLAKEHPEADPRVVILEWMSEQITAYEQKQKLISRGINRQTEDSIGPAIPAR